MSRNDSHESLLTDRIRRLMLSGNNEDLGSAMHAFHDHRWRGRPFLKWVNTWILKQLTFSHMISNASPAAIDTASPPFSDAWEEVYEKSLKRDRFAEIMRNYCQRDTSQSPWSFMQGNIDGVLQAWAGAKRDRPQIVQAPEVTLGRSSNSRGHSGATRETAKTGRHRDEPAFDVADPTRPTPGAGGTATSNLNDQVQRLTEALSLQQRAVLALRFWFVDDLPPSWRTLFRPVVIAAANENHLNQDEVERRLHDVETKFEDAARKRLHSSEHTTTQTAEIDPTVDGEDDKNAELDEEQEQRKQEFQEQRERELQGILEQTGRTARHFLKERMFDQQKRALFRSIVQYSELAGPVEQELTESCLQAVRQSSEDDVKALFCDEDLYEKRPNNTKRLRDRRLWLKRRFCICCYKQRWHRGVWSNSVDQTASLLEMPRADIAWILNMAVGTVSSHVSRTTVRLLNTAGGDESPTPRTVDPQTNPQAEQERRVAELYEYVCRDLRPPTVALKPRDFGSAARTSADRP